jgi:hypothetical protein
MRKLGEGVRQHRLNRLLNQLSNEQARREVHDTAVNFPDAELLFRFAQSAARDGDVVYAAAWLREIPPTGEVARTKKAEVVTTALENSSGGEAVRKHRLAGKIHRRRKI